MSGLPGDVHCEPTNFNDSVHNPSSHCWRNSVPDQSVLIVNGNSLTVIVGESLNPRVLDIRESAIPVADLVPFVMATCGGSQRRSYSVNTEDGVAHSCATQLITEYLDTAHVSIDLGVMRNPFQCRFGEVEIVENIVLQDRSDGNEFRAFRKRFEFGTEKTIS